MLDYAYEEHSENADLNQIDGRNSHIEDPEMVYNMSNTQDTQHLYNPNKEQWIEDPQIRNQNEYIDYDPQIIAEKVNMMPVGNDNSNDETYDAEDVSRSFLNDSANKIVQQSQQKDQSISDVATFTQNSQKSTSFEFTEVFVWGSDSFGQLGIDSQQKARKEQPSVIKVPRSCSFNILIDLVACGESHSAIVTSHGHLYMMGNNNHGQLGVKLTNQVRTGSPCLVEALKTHRTERISCGKDFTIAITREYFPDQFTQNKREIYGWGNNQFGQLGIEDQSEDAIIQLPTRIQAFDALEQIQVIDVSCGAYHSLFLTDGMDVVSCGQNQFGQCGFDPEECEITNVPFKVSSLASAQITSISAGYQHSLFLGANGHVYGAGCNAEMQLGVGDQVRQTQTPVRIHALSAYQVAKIDASYHSACITSQGELLIWGRGIFGEYPFPQKIASIQGRVVNLSLGKTVSTCTDEQGLVWSWGSNKFGELGLGDQEPRAHPFPVLSLKGKSVTQVGCGDSFVMCLGKDVRKDIPGVNLHVPSPLGRVSRNKSSKQRKSRDSKQNSTRGVSAHKSREGRQNSLSAATNIIRKNKENVSSMNVRKSQGMPPQPQQVYAKVAKTKNRRATSNLGPKDITFNDSTVALAKINQQAENVSLSEMFTKVVKKEKKKDRTISHTTPSISQITVVNDSQEKIERQNSSQEQSTISQSKNGPGPFTTGDSAMTQTPEAPINNDLKQSKKKSAKTSQTSITAKEMNFQTHQYHQLQIQKLKTENEGLNAEHFRQVTKISKLERTIERLKLEQSQATKLPLKELIETQDKLKKSEQKLRKLKMKWQLSKDSKEHLVQQMGDMKTHNEALMKQIEQMESSYFTAQKECAIAKGKLESAKEEICTLKEKMDRELGNVEIQKAQDDKKNAELQIQVKELMKQLQKTTEDLNSFKLIQARDAQRAEQAEQKLQTNVTYIQSLEEKNRDLNDELKNAHLKVEKVDYQQLVSTVLKRPDPISRTRDRSKNRERSSSNNAGNDRNLIQKDFYEKPDQPESRNDICKNSLAQPASLLASTHHDLTSSIKKQYTEHVHHEGTIDQNASMCEDVNRTIDSMTKATDLPTNFKSLRDRYNQQLMKNFV